MQWLRRLFASPDFRGLLYLVFIVAGAPFIGIGFVWYIKVLIDWFFP